VRQAPPNAADLARAAQREVETWSALWRGDLRRAIALAEEVIDRLGGGDELRAYRCFWLYLAASWAAELVEEADAELAVVLQREMEECARTLSWVPRIELAAPLPLVGAEHDERAERAADKLKRLGIRGLAFEAKLAEIGGAAGPGRGHAVRAWIDGTR
jgi:hypothetical protein